MKSWLQDNGRNVFVTYHLMKKNMLLLKDLLEP